MALVSYMRRDLMEKRGWISHPEFLNGLALASLCPGPIATQLAIYIGWFHARLLGATSILIAFTLPSFLIILSLAAAYTHYGNGKWTQAALYGISPCVIAIVLRNGYQLSKAIVAKDYWLWGIFILNIILASFTHIPVYWVLLGSGLLGWLFKSTPRILFSPSLFIPLGLSLEALASHHISAKLFLYFAWTGTVVFGSGYAIIPFIHEGVVQNFHWLTERQFLDAISIGMITPGPIVLAVTFIGYLIAGMKGALAATLGVFLPCYLFVIIFAPHFHRVAHREGLKAFIQGVTIGVAGAITGTSILLGKNSITNVTTAGIFLGSFFVLYHFKRIKEPVWVVFSALIGILAKGFL